MSLNSECPLCVAQRITTRYYADDECWIADCLICHVPMVVWRHHDPTPPASVREELRDQLSAVADEVFGADEWYYDDHMRNIPDHYHGHARPR